MMGIDYDTINRFNAVKKELQSITTQLFITQLILFIFIILVLARKLS